MKSKMFLSFFILTVVSVNVLAQDDMLEMLDNFEEKTSEKIKGTFKATRLINAHTSETMGKGDLDFRVDHRFGNASIGHDALWGLDNLVDMRLAFEFGITNNLNVGFGRSKGNYFDGFVKYKLLHQTTDNKTPITVTWFSNVGAMVSGGGKEMDWRHRLSYVHQVILARKINSKFSLQLSPLFLHRNYVAEYEENNFITVGIGARYMFTKSAGIIIDFYQSITNVENEYATYYPPLGVGFELETGGHVFHVTFTNAIYLTENRFIGTSPDGWENNDFKFGFNISRVF